MAREQYQPVTTVDIPAKTVSTVSGKRIDNRYSPLKRGHIPRLATVVTDNSHGPEEAKLRRISPEHGRSFELITGRDNSTILFADQYGNIYTSITLKGNQIIHPNVSVSESQPSGFQFSGLQDGTAIDRITQASRILRASNVDTEIILKIMYPNRLPYRRSVFIGNPMEYLPIADFKKKMPGFYDLSKPDQAHVLKTPLIITVRGMSCPERLGDLSNERNLLIGCRSITKVFERINLIEKTRGSTSKQLDPSNQEDLYFYLTQYLPQRIAKNLGLMHRAGLVHNYLTPHNINAMGGIIDLDSVSGKPLGDRKATRNEFKGDLIDTYKTLFDLKNVDFNQTAINFFVDYLRTRGLNEKTRAGSNEISDTLNLTFIRRRDLIKPILERLKEAKQKP